MIFAHDLNKSWAFSLYKAPKKGTTRDIKNEIMSNYTFNDLPDVVATLVDEIRGLKALVESGQKNAKADNANPWMTLKEFQQFHPEHPAAPTIYGWVRGGLVPYYKKGKKLIFKRQEIEDWLNAGRQKTDIEMETEAINYINHRRTGK